MSRRLIFWVIMLIWALFSLALVGGYVGVHFQPVGQLVEFVLFLLLGWQVYGKPIDG